MAVNPSIFHPQLDVVEQTPQAGQDGNNSQTEPLLAGKYKSTEELERGYQNLFTEGQKIVEQKKALEQRVAQLESWTAPAGGDVSSRQLPSDREAARVRPMDALAMAGIPVQELRDYVREELRAEIQPIFQGAQARQSVMQDYPEFSKFEPELAQFLEANPGLNSRYTKAYATDPDWALRGLYEEFRKTRGVGPDASGAAQFAARVDAQLPGRSAVPRGAVQDGFTEQYEKAVEKAQKTGNWSPVLALKLGNTVADNHYKGIPGYEG